MQRVFAKIKEEVNAEDYDHPLKGFKIVVDAGNGAGGFYADKVLSVLGADTTGSRYLEPDGMFPNHIPNPEDATAMASICEAVKEANADLGVILTLMLTVAVQLTARATKLTVTALWR